MSNILRSPTLKDSKSCRIVLKQSLNKRPMLISKDFLSTVYGKSSVTSPVSLIKNTSAVKKFPTLELLQAQNKLKRKNSIVSTNYTSKCGSQLRDDKGYIDALFTSIIEKDPQNRQDLKRIKEYYESYIHELEGLASKSSRKQIQLLATENFKLSKQVETLKRERKYKRKTQSINSLEVPKLKLDTVSSPGFHQEFMNKASEFSTSWRNALEQGR